MDTIAIHEAVNTCRNAAIAASQWIGKGNQIAADQAAVTAMRNQLAHSSLSVRIVIGEGERDKAPMLFIGEQLGSGLQNALSVDVAVDPLEGTGLCAQAAPGALAILAMAPRNTLLHAPDVYMDKIAVGPAAAGSVNLEHSIADNLTSLAKRLCCNVSAITVAVLDRPRHQNIIQQIRQAGARVQLITDGDVAAAILTCMPNSNIQMVLGSGGAPEGVLAACALKALKADMQGRLLFENDEQLKRCQEMMPGQDPKRKLHLNDLVQQDALFVATGVTSGNLLPGVKFCDSYFTTYTLVLSTQEQAQWICQQQLSTNSKIALSWLKSPYNNV